MRSAACPSPNGLGPPAGLAPARTESRQAATEATIVSQSCPASVARPASTISGRSVRSRSTTTGYAAIRSGTALSLYRIDLSAASNAATRLGGIAGVETISGLALVQPD